MRVMMNEESFVMVGDKQLRYLFCSGTEFKKVNTKLNLKWAASLGAEMFSPEGLAYICKNCGYKHEFFK
jgi:hypothetical protein